MTTELSVELAEVNTEILRELAAEAESLTFIRRRIVGGGYDPINGDIPGVTEDSPMNGVAIDYINGLISDSRIIENSIAIWVDRKFEIETDDLIVFEGVEKAVLSVDKVKPAGYLIGTFIQVSI